MTLSNLHSSPCSLQLPLRILVISPVILALTDTDRRLRAWCEHDAFTIYLRSATDRVTQVLSVPEHMTRIAVPSALGDHLYQ